MRRLFVVTLLSLGSLVAQPVVTGLASTSKDVTVWYNIPAAFSTTATCTVRASYSASLSPLLPDVDPAVVSGSDQDLTRNSKATDGLRSRFVVIGKMTPFWQTIPASAATGLKPSYAVGTSRTVYGDINCGGSIITWSTATKSVPFGLTLSEPIPADPNAAGFPNYPSIDWPNAQTMVDGEYGTELTRLRPAGSYAAVASAVNKFQEANGASWTTPTNILVDDSNAAAIAASQAVLDLPWPYSTLAIGSSAANDGSSIDWFQFTVRGSGTAATATDRTIQACLSIIGDGATCWSPWQDIALTGGVTTLSFPASPTPVNHWQATGARPIPKQLMLRRTGTLTYVNSTKTVTITGGDHVGENWAAGTKMRLATTNTAIRNITAGTPLTVQTLTTHGLTTGDKVQIINANGTAGVAANGVWIVTVTDTTHFTLNSSTGAGTYGRQMPVSTGTAGSPPTIHSTNSFFACNSNLLMASFTDSGWTSLNGNVYVGACHLGSTEDFDLTGATTTGAYTSGGTVTQLLGTVQKLSDTVIASIVDGSHVILTSALGADIVTDTSWTVDPVHVLVRKKTTSADTVSLQYATVKVQTSPGTGWGAAAGGLCGKNNVSDGTRLGIVCLTGAPTFYSLDGTTVKQFGYVPMPDYVYAGAGDPYCYSAAPFVTDQGAIAVNPNRPLDVYCSSTTRQTAGAYGGGSDRNIMVVTIEGDLSPRSLTETAADITTMYPGYGTPSAAYPAPSLPNCYGNGKWNDGVNPRIVPSVDHCASYKLLISSVKSYVAARDTRFTALYGDVDSMDCRGNSAPNPLVNFIWRESTNSVWAHVNCVPNNDLPNIDYVFDLGNERNENDPLTTLRLVAAHDSWSADGDRWSKRHGGVGFVRDPDTGLGYLIAASHPMYFTSGVDGGAFPDLNAACTLCGTYWTTYSETLTATPGSCATWAGSPYLPTPTPDGTAGKGCDTITVAHEPCDSSPNSVETAFIGLNPTLHSTKCGGTGLFYLQDAAVGDIVLIHHNADGGYDRLEPGVVVAKSGNSWTLYRGGVTRVTQGNGGYMGTEDHTSDTKRLYMSFTYQWAPGSTGSYSFRYIPVDSLDTPITAGITFGHGDTSDKLTVGDLGSFNLGVIMGSYAHRITTLTPDFTIRMRGLQFNGVGGNDVNSHDSHSGITQPASDLNKTPWILDAAPWNSGAHAAASLVGGTNNVYKWAAADLQGNIYNKLFPKILPMQVRVGPWILRNVSGPTTGNVVTDATLDVFCWAAHVNECRTGSSVGDVYFSTPYIDQMQARQQCCGQDWSSTRDPDITSTNLGSRYIQWLLVNDQTGTTGRAITSAFVYPRLDDPYKNWAVTTDGKVGLLREKGQEYSRSELFSVKMPPIVRDGIDRSHWYYQPINVPARAGADNVIIRFGYQHYGDVAADHYYCYGYTANCIVDSTVTAADPYWFEGPDSVTGVSCASGCTINLPLIPNRTAYYQEVWRSGSSTVFTSPQKVVVSP